MGRQTLFGENVLFIMSLTVHLKECCVVDVSFHRKKRCRGGETKDGSFFSFFGIPSLAQASMSL
jgi:hypothetical protein